MSSSCGCNKCTYSFTGNVPGKDATFNSLRVNRAAFNHIDLTQLSIEQFCECIQLLDCADFGNSVLCEPVQEDCTFYFKTLVAGDNIAITDNVTNLVISGSGGDACTGLNQITVGDGAGGTTCVAPSNADEYLCFDGANVVWNFILTPCTGLNQVTVGDGAGGVTCVAPTNPDEYLCFNGANVVWSEITTVQYYAFNGVIMNATGGGSPRYAEWGTQVPSGVISTLVTPFDAEIIGFSVSYVNNSSINIDPGESISFSVGVVTGAPPAVFTSFGATNITWDNTDDGTYPTGFLTGTLGSLTAGDRIGVGTLEVGTVSPTGADCGVVVIVQRSA